jgi:uncharacterized membrane protein YkvA (DUF1232 family)
MIKGRSSDLPKRVGDTPKRIGDAPKRYRIGRSYSFKQELLILYFAIQDARTPFYAKWVALLAFVYLISPIDLIPDFIPFVGYLDDLVIVPFILHIAFRLVPAEVRADSLINARKHMLRIWIVLIVIGLVLVGILVALFYFVRGILHHL